MKRTVAQQVGAELRRLRKLRGLRLEDLASKTGVDLSQLSKIERGTSGTELEAWNKLAAAVGVSLGTLFGNIGKTDRAPARRMPSALTPA